MSLRRTANASEERASTMASTRIRVKRRVDDLSKTSPNLYFPTLHCDLLCSIRYCSIFTYSTVTSRNREINVIVSIDNIMGRVKINGPYSVLCVTGYCVSV